MGIGENGYGVAVGSNIMGNGEPDLAIGWQGSDQYGRVRFLAYINGAWQLETDYLCYPGRYASGVAIGDAYKDGRTELMVGCDSYVRFLNWDAGTQGFDVTSLVWIGDTDIVKAIAVGSVQAPNVPEVVVETYDTNLGYLVAPLYRWNGTVWNWETSCLLPYTGNHSNGLAIINAQAPVTPLPIGQIKANGAHQQVSINSAVVTAVFPNYFYVEDPLRSGGIMVLQASSGLTVGQEVSVTGVTGINSNDEMYIGNPVITQGVSGSVKPIGLSGKNVGGAALGGQVGVANGVGLNNIGMLVTVWGAYTYPSSYIDDSDFTISDGSGRSIRCVAPPLVYVDHWDSLYDSVTGICSCEIINGQVQPVILIRTASDFNQLL